VTTLLDEYRREWLATRVDACAATNVRKEQSAKLLDLRVRCLARRRRELGELTRVLSTTKDPDLVDGAVKAVYQLRRPKSCSAEAVQQVAPLPADPQKRAAVEREQVVLARVVTQRIAGDLTGARTRAREVVERATELGYQPLIAEARIALARTYLDLNNFEATQKELFEALKAAQRGRSDILVAQVWVLLVIATGAQAHRFDLAMSHAKAAEAALVRASENRNLIARYHYALGTMLLAKGNYKAAKTRLEQALQHGIAAFGENHGTVGAMHSALCDVNMKMEDHATAREHCRKAIAIQTAAFGPDHPSLAVTLNVAGALELGAAKYDAARTYFRRALAIGDRPGNERNITRPLALNNMGHSWIAQGKYRKAVPLLERSKKLFEKYHPDTPRRLFPIINLANVQLQLGNAKVAVTHYRKAMATATKIYGPKHDRVIELTFNTALALFNMNQHAEAEVLTRKALALSQEMKGKNNRIAAVALDLLVGIAMTRKNYREANVLARQALDMARAIYPAGHPEVAYALFRYGHTYRFLKQPARSLAPLRESVAIYSKHRGQNHRRALAQFALARSLWEARRDRTRALALVKKARARLDLRVPVNKRLDNLIERWLHSIRGARR
jgi:tetratricopeptide (TPR) repeat protein